MDEAALHAKIRRLGLVAQLVEQRIENPCVGGSIPPRATKNSSEAPTLAVGVFHFGYWFASGMSPCPGLVIEHLESTGPCNHGPRIPALQSIEHPQNQLGHTKVSFHLERIAS
jgi:hypothetical protein